MRFMPKIRKRHIGTALIIFLIAATASFVALSLTSLQWPFASGSPLSPRPPTPPKPSLGFLVINASYLSGGVQNPVAGGGVSLSLEPGNHLLANNVTDSNGMIAYTLRPGSYFITFSSAQGSAGDTVLVYGSYTTVFNYFSINQTEFSDSFDIVSQQPNIAAPWDTVYVRLQNLYGFNLSSADTFIEPVYSSQLNATLQVPSSNFQIPASIVSQELLPSGLSMWLQLRPRTAFSTNSLTGIGVLEYNSTVIVTVDKNPVSVR